MHEFSIKLFLVKVCHSMSRHEILLSCGAYYLIFVFKMYESEGDVLKYTGGVVDIYSLWL